MLIWLSLRLVSVGTFWILICWWICCDDCWMICTFIFRCVVIDVGFNIVSIELVRAVEADLEVETPDELLGLRFSFMAAMLRLVLMGFDWAAVAAAIIWDVARALDKFGFLSSSRNEQPPGNSTGFYYISYIIIVNSTFIITLYRRFLSYILR